MKRQNVFACIFALFLGLLIAQLAKADPIQDGFYQYTDEAGAVSLTDDLKQVPARYKDQVVQRTWTELSTEVEARWTPQSTSHPVYFWSTPSVADPRPVEEETCTGHITVER